MSSISPSQQLLNHELWWAAGDGDIDEARKALDSGAHLNDQNVDGRTALYWACYHNQPALVRFLLDNKANTNILDNNNCTPLHRACIYGSLSCAQQVVEAGCDTEIRNNDGLTAMEYAARRGHTDIVNYLSTHSKNLEEIQKIQMDTFNSAIKSKGKRTQVLAHATFQGNARSGKTSLCKVISGQSANIHQTSTGVADKPVRIELHHSTNAVVVDDMTWTLLESLDEETALMVKGVKEVTPVDVAATVGTPSRGQRPTKQSVHATTTPISFPGSRQERRRVEGVVKKALKKAGVKIKDLKNPWTLYLSDIGGQVEFQDLIPAITAGPSLHIIVMRASRGLNELCRVEYLHKDGRSAHSYTANYTVKEGLLQSLSTIMSTGRDGLLPKAMIVLTFKDEATEEQIREMDQELQKAVMSTEAYTCGVIKFASNSRLTHEINNIDPDPDDLQQMRNTIQSIIRNEKEFHVTIPYSWQYLSIALREVSERVLQYDTCLEIARECGLEGNDDADDALEFLHKIGVIRHFSKVPNLDDIVITDPQLLFDTVSELVINTFTFECGSHSHAAVKEFETKGIFQANMVDRISTGSELFTSEKFVDFLKHHHIIAPIKEGGIVKRYLLPCSLAHADMEKSVSASDVFPPLMITFSSGYIPRGLFGFLVTDLLENRSEDKFSICLDELVIYRNQITLSVGPYQDQFKFSASSSYLRVDVLPSTVNHKKISLSAICSFIHMRVFCGLEKVIAKLNYARNTCYSLALLCPDPSDSRDPHPATITYHGGEPVALKCSLTKKFQELPESHHVWFNKEYIHPPVPGVAGSSGGSSPTTGDSILKVDTDLRWVMKAVWEARSKWKYIGRALKLSEGTISAFNESEDGESLTKVIKIWMESSEATVHILLEALEDKPVSRCDIANEIREQLGIKKVSLPETSSGSPTTLTDSHPQRISNPEGIVHHGGAHHSSRKCSLL